MFSLYESGAKMFSYQPPLGQEASSSVSKSSKGQLNKKGASGVKDTERRCTQIPQEEFQGEARP